MIITTDNIKMKVLRNRVHRQTYTHTPVGVIPPVNEGILPPLEQGTHILLIGRIGGRGRVDDVGRILNTLTDNTLNQVHIYYSNDVVSGSVNVHVLSIISYCVNTCRH